MNRHNVYYAVEMFDPHPTLGGKTVKFPFAYWEHAELWAQDEVAAAKELGIGNLTYRIVKCSKERPKVTPPTGSGTR